ncbi:MAG: hypothetical protein M1829_006513 [Trizodia sp. TS-e1964]|nr:MAG: hypothetical protein M1829_006513 [Trizodia sp. TS-e1964]
MASTGEISHGRGGAGNIHPDKEPYTDGEITRTGEVGDHGDGAFSTGRGGVANIGSPGMKAPKRNDAEIVPQEAVRPNTEDTIHHTGRGGEGNVHIPDKDKAPVHMGLADRLKRKIFGSKKKDEPMAAEPAAPATTQPSVTSTATANGTT